MWSSFLATSCLPTWGRAACSLDRSLCIVPELMLTAIALAASLTVVAAPSYDARRNSAERIANLGRFLEAYLGLCDSDDPSFNRTECEDEAKRVQRDKDGKTFVVEIDNATEQIHFAGWDKRKDAYRLHLTPFFSERGLGMSVGKPSKLTSEGFPVVKNLPIWVKLPKGESDFSFKRELERGMVRLEILARVKRPWTLKARDGELVRGVEVALVGVRVYPSRGDRPLAEQTY